MRVAVVGAGKVGTAIARTALGAGHDVRISGSGDPADIRLQAQILVPGATPMTTAAAVADADVVILSVPITKYRTLDAGVLAGLIVVDAMNYWPATDGEDPEFADPTLSSSERVAAQLDRSRVVKTLNHIGYHELESDGRPAGSRDRRGLAVVSDDADAGSCVAGLVDSFGFDPVPAQPLSVGRRLEPGWPIFARAMTAAEVATALQATT